MLTDELQLTTGTARDYQTLAEHHYKAARPATMTRVLTLRRTAPTVIGRYQCKADETQVVAVLVESLPTLLCRMRSVALDDRFGTWLAPAQRSRLLNSELRCISRVVVHPQWRGLGLATRLVREALDSAQTIYTEALAAMGNVHPFFEHAGMTAYHRPRHRHDDRLLAAMQSIGLSRDDLADLTALQHKLQAMRPMRRELFTRELHRWFRQTAGRCKNHNTDVQEHLRYAREHLLLEPVYYLHKNTIKKG